MKPLVFCMVIALAFALANMQSTTPAAAAPAAQTTTAWTGTYFANRSLQGTPAFIRDDLQIDFAWGNGTPDPKLAADNFSVRWVRWVYMDAPGTWTLAAIADNGVRLFVDDVLVMDAWGDQSTAGHTITLYLTQAYHLVRMEYYHRGSSAEAHLAMISAAFPDWRGEYFSNLTLSGKPTFTRNDSVLNLNFGTTGPGGGVPGEGYSVRWTRGQNFAAGRYRFTTLTDDGARLWVDNQLIIDQWHDQVPTNRSGDITLTAGLHLIRLEYFNHLGAGLAVLTWNPLAGSAEVWHGEFFDNTGLTGSPGLVRDYSDVNFDWGAASPGPGITDGLNWSARFTSKRVVNLEGFYTVTAAADDGMRIWVDSNLVIDEWHDQPATPFGATLYLSPGTHDWRVEFYQHTGTASLHVQIASGVVSPSVLAASSSVSDVIVEDGAAGFFKGGTAASWREFPAGSGGHALWLQNSTFWQTPNNWARWYPRLAQPGSYEVWVYIPGNIATTHNARYSIQHAGTIDFSVLNQSLYSNQWVSLGTFNFIADGGEYVSLTDATYESPLSAVIVFDAVKFSPR